MFVVVSYDISEDRRRNKIHKTLKNFGQWMQYSVFECNLTKAQYLKLRYQLDKLINEEDDDSVRFYFLCGECQKQIERIGGEMPIGDGPVFV